MEFIFERIISDLSEGYTPPPEAAAAASLIFFFIFIIINAGIIYVLREFLKSRFIRKNEATDNEPSDNANSSKNSNDNAIELEDNSAEPTSAHETAEAAFLSNDLLTNDIPLPEAEQAYQTTLHDKAKLQESPFKLLKKHNASIYARLKLYFRYENTSEDTFSKIIPALIIGLVFAIFTILPWAATHYGQPGQTVLAFSELNTGIFFIIAIGLMAPLTLAYSARKSLNGSSELMIKYTAIAVPWCLSLVGTVIISGSMTAGDIVKAQQAGMFGSPILGWFIVPSILGAACYIYCAAAASELPWSLKSSGQDCGIQTGIMNICEITLIFAVSAYFTNFFLGGWSLPWFYPPNQAELGIAVIPYFDLMCGLTVFFIKTYGLIAAAIWIKLNYAEKISQTLRQYEKYLFPAAVGNIIICSLAAALQQTLGGNL